MRSPSLAIPLVLTVLPALAAQDPAIELEPPVRLEAAGAPIDVDIGHAAPFLADIDGDGKRELLVGQFGEGKLRIHANVGTKARPRFGEMRWFEAGEQLGRVPTG